MIAPDVNWRAEYIHTKGGDQGVSKVPGFLAQKKVGDSPIDGRKLRDRRLLTL
jgi:hypothetical protein